MQRAEELRYLVLAAQREGYRQLSDLLRPLGLTPSQAEVIRVLQESEPLSLVDLGELLVCETGSPSRLVNGLVESGVVARERSPRDRRMITLTLTGRGRELADKVSELERYYYKDIDGALEGTTMNAAIDALWRLVADRPAGRALARRRGHETA